MFAPGLIQNANYNYDPQLEGLGLQPLGNPINPTSFNLITPGTIPTLQGLAGRVFDFLPPNEEAVEFQTLGGGDNLKIAAGDDDKDDDAPKRNRPLLNILKNNPLNAGANKDDSGNASAVKHRPGLGKTPVRDLVKRVLGGNDDGDDDETGGEPRTPNRGMPMNCPTSRKEVGQFAWVCCATSSRRIFSSSAGGLSLRRRSTTLLQNSTKPSQPPRGLRLA